MEAVDRGTLDLDVFHPAPGHQQLADRLGALHAFAVFARVQHELPALAIARGHHVRCGAARVANEFAMVDGIGHVFGIDDQPVLLKRFALELQAELLPDLRVGPIGAHHVAAVHRDGLALRVLQPHAHALCLLLKIDQAVAKPGLHLRVLADFVAQQGFELGLVEGHQHRVAIDDAGRVDARKAAVDRRVVVDARDRGGGELAIAHPQHLQDAQRLVVQCDGPGLGEDLGGLLTHEGLHAVTAQ